MARQVFTVGQVNRYVKRMLDADALLAGVFIEGEISNFNAHSSGHMYFTLKDEIAAISAVMFKHNTTNLNFKPKSGMKVIAFGQLSLYEKTGQYQIYVEFCEEAGVGDLQLALRQLHEKLQGEGLFDESRKLAIPKFAKCVGVITSPTGAAVQDIIRTLQMRNKSVKILVSPAKVQGEGAATELAQAIKDLNKLARNPGGILVPDVIILGRGGGSIEDLWAFNEEILARAIAASKIPIISAVGHETDFTITDFVADKRAATPTAAAVYATFDQGQTIEYVQYLQDQLKVRLGRALMQNVARAQQLLGQLNRHVQNRFLQERQNLAHQEILLEKLSPYAAFKRGYGLVSAQDGTTITSVTMLTQGQDIQLNLVDGKVTATVKAITGDSHA